MQQKLSPIGFRRSVFLHLWDAASISLLFLLWNEIHETGLNQADIPITLILSVSTLLCLLYFQFLEVYNIHFHTSVLEQISRLVGGWVLCVSTVMVASYMLKINHDLPRMVIGPWMVSVPLALVLPRLLIHRVMQSRIRQGKGAQATVVVGESEHAKRVSLHFEKHSVFAIKVIGRINGIQQQSADASTDTKQEKRTETAADGDIPVIGNVGELASLINIHSIQRVIIASDFQKGEQLIEKVLLQLAQHPVTVQFAPDVSNYLMIGFKSDNYAGQPMFDLAGCPLNATDIMMKWIEDKILGILILLVISPLLILVAIAIKCSSPGPILFTQERHGLYGRPIKILKFRSMKIPDSKLEKLQHEQGAEKTSSGKFRQAEDKDPRITAVGSFLRKTSLDELPQFFNVLAGSMSIVGPRPHALEHNQQFTATVDGLMKRHYMKPGITGLAQVNGARGATRTNADMEKRLRYDLHYIRNWSLWLDIKIIFLTIVKGFFNNQP